MLTAFVVRMKPRGLPKYLLNSELPRAKEKPKISGKGWARCHGEVMNAAGIEQAGWTTAAQKSLEWQISVETAVQEFTARWRCQETGETASRHKRGAPEGSPTLTANAVTGVASSCQVALKPHELGGSVTTRCFCFRVYFSSLHLSCFQCNVQTRGIFPQNHSPTPSPVHNNIVLYEKFAASQDLVRTTTRNVPNSMR